MGHMHPATAPGTPMTSPAAEIHYDPASYTVTYNDLHPLYVAGAGPGHPPIAGNGPAIWGQVVPAGRA